ncbi:MAG: SurA N-terminal domain-containing protein [Bacillota bacterium]
MDNEEKNQENGPEENGPVVKITSKKTYIAIAAAVIILAGLGISFALGVFDSLTEVAEEPETDAPEEVVEEPEEEPENGTVIATINGEEVTRGELNMAIEQQVAQYEMQGIDMESEEMKEMKEELKEQVFENNFVIPILLEQKATEAGIEISDEEIEARYMEYATQLGGEEALEDQIEQMGLSKEEVEEEIALELTVRNYLDQYLENYLEENPDERIDEEKVEIDDEEVEEFYQQIIDAYEEINAMLEEEDPEMPTEQAEMQLSQIEQQYGHILEAEDLEEARPLIEDEMREEQLSQEKQENEQRIFMDMIEDLKEEADIEIQEDL